MFEENIRKNRSVVSNWMKYAQWEQTQEEYDRARSIYECAFDVDHRCITLWLKYAEMEMKNKQINHARNIWDRAVTLLPRINQFWFKYAYMEEMLGNIPNEVDKAQSIYERFILVHSETKNWICYARFEESQGFIDNARNIFERATEFFGDEGLDEKLYMAFAQFEESCQEYERSHTIFKYALDKIPKPRAVDLFKAYTHFEKKYGDRIGNEDAVINKRKFQYEDKVKDPSNYDAWFDYIRLLESNASLESTRDLYERAIANVPPLQEKTYWQRYIYLWINYALYEELIANDIDRTREVYKSCVNIVPHTRFTFAKVWLLYAQFEIRQKELATARKVLGTAIGKCPKRKLFKGYIELELQLLEFDRFRKIYAKYLEYDPGNSITWIKYAELEAILGLGRCGSLPSHLSLGYQATFYGHA
uniref:Pre-mRNA-splicing factor Syf1/CRNKL1-like C-terminal HAT-repeats domain-containing protein n=1 Tax=Amphimedon queenslandica TaxID=400682 RepID=A0A1X7VRQ6_AMPQE